MATVQSPLTAKTLLPGFTVDDLDRSIAFYEALGFGVADRWEQDGALIGVMMQAGEQQIGLNPCRANGRARSC